MNFKVLGLFLVLPFLPLLSHIKTNIVLRHPDSGHKIVFFGDHHGLGNGCDEQAECEKLVAYCRYSEGAYFFIEAPRAELRGIFGYAESIPLLSCLHDELQAQGYSIVELECRYMLHLAVALLDPRIVPPFFGEDPNRLIKNPYTRVSCGLFSVTFGHVCQECEALGRQVQGARWLLDEFKQLLTQKYGVGLGDSLLLTAIQLFLEEPAGSVYASLWEQDGCQYVCDHELNLMTHERWDYLQARWRAISPRGISGECVRGKLREQLLKSSQVLADAHMINTICTHPVDKPFVVFAGNAHVQTLKNALIEPSFGYEIIKDN